MSLVTEVDHFNWDDESDFTTEAPAAKVKEILKAVESADIDLEDETEKGDIIPKEKEVDVDEILNFDNEGQETEDKIKGNNKIVGKTKDDLPDEDEDDDEVKVFSALADDLFEEGIFSTYEKKEGEKVTKEKFFDTFEQEVDARVEENFKGFFEEVKQDPDAIAFLNHMRNGGSAKEFLSTYASAPLTVIPDGIDITKEKNQKLVTKHYLQVVEGMDSEEAEDRIEYLEEKGKLEGFTEKALEKLNALDAKQKAAVIKAQEDRVKIAKANAENFKASLQDTIGKVDSVGKFKFNPTDKKTLVDALTKATVKTKDNQVVTAFAAKWAEILKSPEKLLLTAKLVLSDFKTDDLVTDIQSQVTEKAKSKLVEAKLNDKKLSNKTGANKSLADYF